MTTLALAAVVPTGRLARAPLEASRADDRYYDYTLRPYQPVAATQGKLRSENVLVETFAREGVEREGLAVVEALRASLGGFRTVWGVKHHARRAQLGWELYFYDPQRTREVISLPAVLGALAPLVKIDAAAVDLPWHMFSIELSPAHLRGEETAPVHLYLDTNETKGVDRSYVLRGGELAFENVYSFHDPATEIDEVLHRLQFSVFKPPGRRALADLIPPELFACHHVCVANKHAADALYFSRITTAQLLFALARFGWPEEVRRFVAERSDRFDHLLWDLGYDFAAPDGALQIEKSGFYGSF